MEAGVLPPGYAADDGVALHFVGTELREAVSSRPHAGAWRLEAEEGSVREREIPTRYLGTE